MKKARIQFPGRCHGRSAHDLASSAAVIAAVRNDVQEHFFTTHEASVSYIDVVRNSESSNGFVRMFDGIAHGGNWNVDAQLEDFSVRQ